MTFTIFNSFNCWFNNWTRPKLKRTWNLVPVLQIIQKILENYCPCLYLAINQVWQLYELYFKRYIYKCTLSHVLILFIVSQILQIMGWFLKTGSLEQNINFLQNEKILNLCFRWFVLRFFDFVVDVTFNSFDLRWFGRSSVEADCRIFWLKLYVRK